MRALGAIVVGIGHYRYDRPELPPLRFSPTDAEEVAKYLRACWPKVESSVIAVDGRDATFEAIDAAFSLLARGAPFDLLVIFLSGHGLVDKETAGFVIQPANDSSEVRLLDTTALDRLLASVAARQVVFVLDCCHAEGITRRMSFFSGLSQSDARLFIASSREDQLTWEDERVGHGIFTAHLLDLLRTGNSAKLNGVREQLDVDGELFPVLCDQVPLYVLEHKQARQEPVKGGVLIRAVTLPVARSARRLRDRTAFGTAVRRLRQIVAGIAIAGATFLLFAYLLTYYAEADRDGSIRVYHGTKWLAPLFRLIPTLRIDTGISSSDLSGDPTNRYAVQTGAASGIWTHMTTRGIRAWYAVVRPSLDAEAAAKYDVLVASEGTAPVYGLRDESLPPAIAFAAWAILDSRDSGQLESLFPHMLGADRSTALDAPFSGGDMDFNVLDLTPHQLSQFSEALTYAAAVDPDRAFVPYLGYLKAIRLWLAHSSPEQHGLEAQRRVAEDAANLLAVIAKARVDRGKTPIDADMHSKLGKLSNAGYADLVNLALSRAVKSPEEQKRIALRAFSAFHGNPAEPAEDAAMRQIEDSLDSSLASQSMVQNVYERFVSVGGSEQSYLTAFLIAAADKKALPSSLISMLIAKAKVANDRQERVFMDSEYARILAHGMGQVPEVSRGVAYHLIDLVAAEVTPLSTSTAEIYSALARQQLETPSMLKRILENARAAPHYQPQNPSAAPEPLPGISIIVGYGPWLEALASLGEHGTLAPEAKQILERHADDPDLRASIVRALAHQAGVDNGPCQLRNCGAALKEFPKDGARRRLAADILAERLAILPRDQFLNALEEIRQERGVSVEPEIRIALGLVAINSQLARIRLH